MRGNFHVGHPAPSNSANRCRGMGVSMERGAEIVRITPE